ncbi:MAG TPA: hypothetical protein VJN22_01855 [Candidatus Eremiobacteraceae bacterium]|nr:hypothetical protein [Candidatus Eremiobacteraceae bacterium]
MQRIRLLTCDAGMLGGQLDEVLAGLAPDVVALTGIAPGRALRIAGPRSMRSATQAWSADNDSGLALLWKASFAVGSLDRFDFGQERNSFGALRISFPLDGRFVNVYCALLSHDGAAAAGQQMRLAALLDLERHPTLVACESITAQSSYHWSRCIDAWTIAQRRVVSLATSGDAGLSAQRAFGVSVGSTAVDRRSQEGPTWHCSEEFSVIEARSIANSGSPGHPVRTATVALRASAADENIAIAL